MIKFIPSLLIKLKAYVRFIKESKSIFTLFHETRKSGLEKREAVHISRVASGTCHRTKVRRFRVPDFQPSMTMLQTLAKVFCVLSPKNVKNRPFLGIHQCITFDPDFSSLPNFDPQIERSSADNV